ncbi:hypothetical protein [Streptomyces sp. NBC_00658]|uniref:hypothetical protein n=1 Tax=Streptomyces sp. NBC_00658 TaxID=2975800 RepID=UPI0032494D29
MSEPVAAAQSVVQVDYHTFHLADADAALPPFIPTNGLAIAQPGIVVVVTGASSGRVSVAVEVREAPPAELDANAWDEVVDVTLEATTGRVRVASLMADAPELPVLTPFGPGPYRVRVHARGRDIAPDGVAFEPVEDYLVITWPDRPQPDVVHKRTDRHGEQLREYLQRHPPPDIAPQPVDNEQQRRDDRLRRAASRPR